MSRQRTGTFKSWTWGASINSPASPFSSVEKHVGLTLEKFMSPQGDSCWPSMETLAEHASRSISTVRDALRRLTEFGWLERELRGGRGKSNRYVAVIPEYFDRDESHEENHRRAVGFQNGALEPASVQALPDTESKPTGERRVSDEGVGGETHRSPSLNPPDSVVKPTGVRHQLDQDQSKDQSTLNASELATEVEGLDLADAIALVLTVELAAGKLTRSETGRWRAAIAELVEVGATPDEVRGRCQTYRRIFPDAALTPHALVRHWNLCGARTAVTENGAEASSVDAWVEKTGWRLDPEDAKLHLEDMGLPADRIEAALVRTAEIRAEHAAADQVVADAIAESKAA